MERGALAPACGGVRRGTQDSQDTESHLRCSAPEVSQCHVLTHCDAGWLAETETIDCSQQIRLGSSWNGAQIKNDEKRVCQTLMKSCSHVCMGHHKELYGD